MGYFEGSTASRPQDSANTYRSTIQDHGLIIKPNRELEGIKVEVSTGSTGLTQVKLYRQDYLGKHVELANKYASNGDTVTFEQTLGAGQKYNITGWGYDWYPGFSQNVNFPFSSADIDIEYGIKFYGNQFEKLNNAYCIKSVTALLPVDPPSTPQNLSSSVSGDEISLNWDSVDWNGDQGSYKIFRAQSSGFVKGDYTNITNVASGTTSFTDTGLEDGQKYYYRVQATNSGGDSSLSNETAETTALPATSILSFTEDTSDDRLSVEFDRQDLSNDGDLIIWVSPETNSNHTDSSALIVSDSSGGPNDEDTVPPSGGYHTLTTGFEDGEKYYVSAIRRTPHKEVTTQDAASLVTTLSAPSTPSLDASTTGEITLSWSRNDNSSDGSYQIYRSSDGSTGGQIATISNLSNTSYTDTGVEDGEKYYYRIRRDTGDKTKYSGQSSAVTNLPAPTVDSLTYVADDQLDFSFTANDDHSDANYHVQLQRDNTTWQNPAGGPTKPGSDGTYSYGPNSGNSYYQQVGIDSSFRFRVRAETEHTTSGFDYSGTVYTTPIPPHNPSVSRPDANTFEISWENKTDNLWYTKIKVREDTGNGYGDWDNFRNVFGDNSTTINVGDSSAFESLTIKEDARYQFKMQNAGNDDKRSHYVYADYGNNGNVFFEDDFESGDLSKWRNTPHASVNSGSGYSSGFSSADQGSNWARVEADGIIDVQLPDLSNESDIIVKAAVAVGSADADHEELSVDFWDGNAWQKLTDFHWEYNRQGWVEMTTLVPDSYTGGGDYIRFRSASGGGGDHYYIDRVVVSDILHEYTKPAAPSNLELDPTTAGEITATWTKNSATFPDSFQEYRDRVTGSGNNLAKTGLGSQEDFVKSGYKEGKEYDVRIDSLIQQFRNGNVDSYWRGAGTLKSVTTRLPLPSNLSVSNITDTSADLSWTDNTSDENGYEAYLKEAGNPRAMDFDGSNDYIDLGRLDPECEFGTGPFTFAARVNFETTGDYKTIFELSKYGHSLLVRPDYDELHVFVDGDSFKPTVGWNTGTDYDIIVTRNTVDDVYVFVNGTSYGSKNMSGSMNIYQDSYIGQSVHSDSQHFDGTIRDVALWDDILYSDDRERYFNGSIPKTNSLVGYWPLNENNGGTTPDMSGLGNDGTVNGATLVGDAYTNASGTLGANSNSHTLSSLLNGTDYETKLRVLGNDVNGEIR